MLLRKSQNVPKIDISGNVDGYFRKKTLHFFKIAQFGEMSLECVSEDTIAPEIWKRSKVGAVLEN